MCTFEKCHSHCIAQTSPKYLKLADKAASPPARTAVEVGVGEWQTLEVSKTKTPRLEEC